MAMVGAAKRWRGMGQTSQVKAYAVLKHAAVLGIAPVHSGHGPARPFPARWGQLPRVGRHNIHPDDAPARGGGPGRRLEPPVDPGPSPTQVKTGLIVYASAGLRGGRRRHLGGVFLHIGAHLGGVPLLAHAAPRVGCQRMGARRQAQFGSG